MFVELMPLLADRTVMITVARVDDQTLRVNVMATKSESENPALSTPLSCTGAPAELDAELGKLLADFVECHQQLSNTLAVVKAEMEAAAKAAQEEARKKAEERRKKVADKPVANSAAPAPAPNPAPPPSATASLFGDAQPAHEPAARAIATGGAVQEGCSRLTL